MEQESIGGTASGVASRIVGTSIGVALGIIAVCMGLMGSCAGLAVIGGVERARHEAAIASSIALEDSQVSIERFGSASKLRKVSYATKIRNTGTAPLEINGWLKVLDERGLELGRDHVATVIPVGEVWQVEGYVMDMGAGEPTTIKYSEGW
jgi:hypothetical protein